MPVFGAGGQERNKSSLPKQEAVKRSRSNNPRFVDWQSVLEKYPEICHADY